MANKLKVGQEAPNFQAETFGGEKISLNGFREKKVVALYFYPKDNTPTCTIQACSIRDGMKDLEKHEIQVLGVSTDGIKSHEKFKNKYGLNFPLLSDTGKNIVKAYGVEGMFGSARRVTFLIDKSGNISYIWKKVKADSHATEIIEKAIELGLASIL